MTGRFGTILGMVAASFLALALFQPQPDPSHVFILRASANVVASAADGAKLKLRPRIRMAVGDVISLTKDDSKLVLVSLKTGRREEVLGKGTAVISDAGWTAQARQTNRLADMDVAFLNRSFSSKTKVREKLGEVVRTGASAIPFEARRPMGAVPLAPAMISLASWQGVQSQRVLVWEGDRSILDVEAKRGDKAVALGASAMRPGFKYRWEVRVQTSVGVEKVAEDFWPLQASDLASFQSLLKDSLVLSTGSDGDPDKAIAVVNRALELGMKGIALDILSAYLVKNPSDDLMKAAREELIKELEGV